MNPNLSSVLDILHEAETARKEGCLRVCELLSLEPSSAIARILVEKENELGRQRLTTLLKEVAQILEKHGVQRIITDWPFENFWGNPHEPRHSKLLGFFINPERRHGCGHFLLSKLLKVLEDSLEGPEHRFPADGCEVRAESDYIDLRIERKCDDRKYAIIIENKVNEARNQDEQLQTYVERLKRGFKYSEIYVFYLPLTSDKSPDSADWDWIEKSGAHCKKITFDEHILKWLNAVLRDWPQDLGEFGERMREHVSHYRNLIDCLSRKRKEFEMNTEILKQLKLAEDRNALPTMSDVEKVKRDAESLLQCMQQVLRAKLLLEIQRILLRELQSQDVWFCLKDEPTPRIADEVSPYNEEFGDWANICVRAGDTVSVCFGVKSAGFWFGYMREGNSDKKKDVEELILLEAREHLKDKVGGEIDDPWYKWAWWRKEPAYSDDIVANISPMVAKELLQMRKCLTDRLKLRNVRS